MALQPQQEFGKPGHATATSAHFGPWPPKEARELGPPEVLILCENCLEFCAHPWSDQERQTCGNIGSCETVPSREGSARSRATLLKFPTHERTTSGHRSERATGDHFSRCAWSCSHIPEVLKARVGSKSPPERVGHR